MSKQTENHGSFGVPWEHFAGCVYAAGVTFFAIFFEQFFWIYDSALEAERLLVELLLDRVSFRELFETAPPGQVLVSFIVYFGDRVAEVVQPGAEITHGFLRLVLSGYVTFECLRALIYDTDWDPSEAPRTYSIFFTVLIAMGPFALLLSQMGVSSLLSLAIATPLLRVVFGLDLHREHVDKLEPVYFVALASLAGLPGITFAFFLSVGCLIQSVLFRDYSAASVSALTLILGAGVSLVLVLFGAGWPTPAYSIAVLFVVLSMSLPLLLVVVVFLAPVILRGRGGVGLTLPVIAVLIILTLVFFNGGNLLLAVALLLLAYTGMWTLHPSMTQSVHSSRYRALSSFTTVLAWLFAPTIATIAYSLSSNPVWNLQTIGFGSLVWACILIGLVLFLYSPHDGYVRRSVLVVASFASIFCVVGITSQILRAQYTTAPITLAQNIWSLCRDAETPQSVARVESGVDPLTQRLLGPAQRSQVNGMDVLYVRVADAEKPENAIDILQIQKPNAYLVSIVTPTEVALERCLSAKLID